MYPPDAAILLEAKKAWGGDRVLPSWDAHKPCDQWQGVSCDATGRAAALRSVFGVLLVGKIPSSLGGLIGLQTLDLSYNGLFGSLPSSLGNLTRLQHLNLAKNQLSGSLPSSLANLIRLQSIALNLNQVSGSLPSSLGSMTRLTSLYLGANQLSGSLPSSLGKLTGLTALRLCCNQLSGSLPSILGNLTGLQDLHLPFNQLSGSLPASLGKLTRLQTLELQYNQLSGSLPSSLGSFIRLTYLDLSSNQLSGSLPSTLGKLTALQYLSLHANQLSGSLPSSLGSLSGLQRLHLFSNKFTGSLPPLPPVASVQDNYLSGSCPSEPLSFSLRGNCFQNCSAEDTYLLRSKRECLAPCGSTSREGPCLGQGTCFFGSSSEDAWWCACNPGFVSPSWNPGTCTPALPPPPLSPPSPPLLGGMFPPDAAILLEAKAEWGGDKVLPSWGAAFPCDQWEGVSCDATGRAAVVSPTGWDLRGRIPSSVGGLIGLQQLNLSSNQLFGTVPSSLGKLTGLQFVDLHNNQLSGSLPSSLGNLTGLMHLRLSSNQLSGSLPSSLGNSIGLTYLEIDNNKLSGSLPSSLGSLIRLQKLDLSWNQLSGSIPSSLASLTGLQYLSLRGNQMSGSLPSSLGNLKGISTLDLVNNQLSGSLPSSLGNLIRLQSLVLSSNQLSGSLPSSLGSLTSLTHLDLHSNQLSGSLPSSLGNLIGLTYLKLAWNELSGSLPSSLFTLTGMRFLVLSYNLLTGPPPPRPLNWGSSLWIFSYNYLSGSCKSGGSWGALGSELESNCFRNCSSIHNSRSPEACSYACGSDQPMGPCQGVGVCFIGGPNKVASCVCNPGFVSPASNPGTCVPTPATAPPPPPPGPPSDITQGVSFLEKTPARARNRWSRFLSSKYKPSNGFPRWSIESGSFWMAPKSAFLGSKRLAADPGATRILRWWGTRDQGPCAACWAMASTDAVAAAQTIAASSVGGDVAALSVPQVLGCSANDTSGACSGDYPTTALEYAAGSVLLNNATFPKAEATCSAVPKTPPSIIMYESVQFRGWFGLLLTLQKQPALVILEAGAPFQQENCVNTKLVFQDPSCYSGNLNHAVLVVGYDISAAYPFWLIRNSWGESWCYGGYMRLAIQGGSGVCGMNVLPAYYPVAAPPAGDPCYTKSTVPNGDIGRVPALNPCGGGTCEPAPTWGAYSYTCSCPDDFVAVNNTVQVTLLNAGLGITQACAPVDACGLALTNPCSVGTCVNNGRGSYSCLCPIGYFNDMDADGQSTCSIGQAPARLIVQPGVTCCLISATYNITTQQLLDQNPGLDCSSLIPGQVVNTAKPSFSCAIAYTVTSEYLTFSDIAGIALTRMIDGAPGISEDELAALNPNAICSADGQLAKGQVICLRAGSWTGLPTCNQLYVMQKGDSCLSVTDRFFPRDPIPFYGLNPGLNCGVVSNPGPGVGVGSTGLTVCVGSEPVGSRKCPSVTTLNKLQAKTALHVGLKGDTCTKVLGKQCKKFKDGNVFSKDAFLSTNMVPDCSNVRGFQFCCPT